VTDRRFWSNQVSVFAIHETTESYNVVTCVLFLGSSAFSPFQSLQFESCQISLACCRLLKLMHEVLKQATDGSSGPAVAVMLYRTSRDCLDIFEGVVQVRRFH
jgi:hypothetical protein